MTVEVTLLRAFTVTVDGVRVHLTSGAQRLVAFLALGGQPATRAYVSGTLWPETTTQRANASLRSAVWRVQHSCTGLLTVTATELALAASCQVDVRNLTVRARRLLDRTADCADLFSPDTMESLAADLLPGWYDDWLTAVREQFHQLRLHALEALCVRLTAAGRCGEAVEAGQAAVRAEPLRETAHKALIAAHLAAGNRGEAVRQHERCRHVLLSELGIEPTAQLPLVATPSYPLSSRPGTSTASGGEEGAGLVKERGGRVVVGRGDAGEFRVG